MQWIKINIQQLLISLRQIVTNNSLLKLLQIQAILIKILNSLKFNLSKYCPKMSVNKTAAKSPRPDPYIKSPRNNYGSQQTLTEGDTETRLIQKINKLKNALRASERHNQQLHAKLKHYRMKSNEEIPALQQQIRSHRKKLETLEMEHQEEIDNLKAKKQQELRALSAGKITHDTRLRDLEIQIKVKDMKIVQLQGIIKDLNQKIEIKQNEMKELYKKRQSSKVEKDSEQMRKLNKFKEQFQAKAAQSQESIRQNAKLKQSLRDSLKKIDKANAQLAEQTQKNKQLQGEIKQLRKFMDSLQKQNINLRQMSDKMKTQALQRLNLIRKLEKCILEHEFKQKRQAQRYQQLVQKHEKLQQQFKSLLTEFQLTSSKYQDLMTTSYELQRDYERQLHTIVKQLTRRHIVSKNLINGMTTSRSFGSLPRDQDHLQHELV